MREGDWRFRAVFPDGTSSSSSVSDTSVNFLAYNKQVMRHAKNSTSNSGEPSFHLNSKRSIVSDKGLWIGDATGSTNKP